MSSVLDTILKKTNIAMALDCWSSSGYRPMDHMLTILQQHIVVQSGNLFFNSATAALRREHSLHSARKDILGRCTVVQRTTRHIDTVGPLDNTVELLRPELECST